MVLQDTKGILAKFLYNDQCALLEIRGGGVRDEGNGEKCELCYFDKLLFILLDAVLAVCIASEFLCGLCLVFLL